MDCAIAGSLLAPSVLDHACALCSPPHLLPSHLLENLLLAPALIVSVVTALACLMHIGAAPEAQQVKRVSSRSVTGRGSEMGLSPDWCSEVSFAGWDVKAPLGVIHEGHEGQENGSGGSLNVYGGPSWYAVNTDSEASSEGEFRQPVVARDCWKGGSFGGRT
ncbi:hypothetical protein ACJRO7_017411 [Eucalyptus globulus]|uniref:Uncharacterized protein n=1 Tax=Eucalyptus globulus TaxID=34317 RepID=A0ABD3KRC1_EUCGL